MYSDNEYILINPKVILFLIYLLNKYKSSVKTIGNILNAD